MKTKSILVSMLLLTVLLVQPLGLSQAQGPGPEPAPQSPDAVDIMVRNRIPVQGELTDASGSPLSGSYNVTFRLYDDDTGGAQLCEDTQTLVLSNGLFSTAIEGCTVSDLDGKQAYGGS